jgi:hypothetical protein
MTIYAGPTAGLVTGQPISGSFGLQHAGAVAAPAPITVIPPNMTQLEAYSRALVPLNINVTAVNGISTGVGDPCSALELMTNGNGVPACRGAPLPPSGGINDQQFAVGTAAPTFQENGPTQTNTDPQTLAPVSGAGTRREHHARCRLIQRITP